MSEKFLTTEEVAALMNVTPLTIRRLTHNGTLRGFKLGRKILYTPDDISKALKEVSNPLKPQSHAS